MPSVTSGTQASVSPPIKQWDRDALKELGIWIQEQYKQCKSDRDSFERQWHLNMHFTVGKQYVEMLGQGGSPVAGKLHTPKAPPWRTRLTVNRIRGVVRTEISRLTAQKPNASVVPASSEDADIFAAQAGEQIWESLYATKQIAKDFRRSAYWTVVTGNGFLKCFWDKTCIDKISGLPGDISVTPVTPFHIFVPNLREEELERQLYVIHAYTRPYKVVKQQYGDLIDDKLQANVVEENEIIEAANLNLTSGTKKPDSVMVYEMWLKPGAHSDFPLGGLIQCVDKYVVNIIDTGIPYEHGEFPFIHFTHIPTGTFYGASVIEDLISLQKEYNRTRSQIVEAKNRTAKPQLLAAVGSVDPSKITSEPGQVILYRPGMPPPQPLPIQSIPPYVLQELDRTLMDIEDITAQHAVSKGNVPTGVTAATAISYLQERDDSVLAPTYASVEEGMEKLARQCLSHVVQYWDLARTVKITGDDGAFDTLVLKGAQVASGKDIRMEGGSALPISKAARQAFLMDLMKMGFIPPDQGLRLMDLGGVQKLYDQLAVDERQAQRENLKMKMIDEQMILSWEQQRDAAAAFAESMQMMQGGDPTQQGLPPDFPQLPPGLAQQNGDPAQPSMNDQAAMDQMPPELMGGMGMPQPDPTHTNDNGTVQTADNLDPVSGLPVDMPLLVPCNTWDNHAVHIEVHNRFRKGQAFESLPDAHKRLFEAHVSLHAKMLNAASSAAMMQGMPPEAMPPGTMPGGEQPAPGGANQFTPGGM